MSTFVVELVGTSGSYQDRTLKYAVHNADGSEVLARALVDAVAPLLYDGLVKQDVHVEEIGDDYHECTVQYGTIKKPEPGQVEWGLEISGGGSQHITQSLETISKTAVAGKTATDHKGAINVRRDGNGWSVEGLDIDVTTFAWWETHYVTYETVTPAYLNALYLARGKVNDAAWRFFGKGEVRIVSIDGGPKGEQAVGLTFHFEASASATDLAVGAITVASKEGWHYLWVEYEKVPDASAKAIAMRPRAAYVERIYDYVDFSAVVPSNPWE